MTAEQRESSSSDIWSCCINIFLKGWIKETWGRGGGSTHNKVVTVEVHELVVNARKLACFKHSDTVDLVPSYNFRDNSEVGPV